MECLQAQSLIAKVVAIKEGTKVWSRFMGGLRLQKGVMPFLLKASSNSLLTSMKLHTWHLRVSSAYTLCSQKICTTAYILFGWPTTKNDGRYSEAWLSTLQLRESLIGLLVLGLVPHTVCLPGLRASEVPQATISLEVAVTSSRTDIVIFQSKELHLLLLWQHLRGPSCCTGIGSGVLRVPANTS